MSKPIKMTMIFHDDNRIECDLSSIQGVSPRTLNDGYRMLRKRYREMVAEERARIEKGARQASLDTAMAQQKADKKADDKEAARLRKATKKVEERRIAIADEVAEAEKANKAADKAAEVVDEAADKAA